MPEPGNPQSLNRFSYVLNNPLGYVDPTGFDPLDAAWEAAFRDKHGGRGPTDQDRRDRLFSLMFLGHGPGGEWTDDDWAFYAANRVDLWRGGPNVSWPGEIAAGIERFAVHVERLASYYKPHERNQFVAAFGFVFGGVPLGHYILSAWDMATPANCWTAYPPLFEGSEGWRPELVDDENPSHHYAGLFYMGYFFGASIGRAVNWLRDGPLSVTSEPDLVLGDLAADQGQMLAMHRYPMSRLGDVLRRYLNARDEIWPRGYPY